MKANNKTIFLFCVVAAVWGYAFYSFFGTFTGEKYNYSLNNEYHSSGEIFKGEDSIILLANYRDPFLGQRTSGQPVSSDKKRFVNANSKKVKVPEKNTPPPDLSFIAFHGMITNPSTKKKIALMSIRDKQYMVSEGEEVEGISLEKNGKDSILVSYNKQSFYLKRK
jgi:hypothetical protein